MRTIVRQLMESVRTKVAKDAELVARIAPLVGHAYSAGSVSGWRGGHDRIPADVLLAACQVTGVSIDAMLFPDESLKAAVDQQRQELAGLRAAVERLEAQVRTRPLLAGESPSEFEPPSLRG